jgi:hypothetical protein
LRGDSDFKEKVDDQREYDQYVTQMTGTVETGVADYTRFVISAYVYFRSRLLVPGRCYEDTHHGPLAIGGAAHADVMDLDRWLDKQNGDTLREALDWMRGSSLADVAYWRGLGHASSVKRRRDKIVENHDNPAKNDTGEAKNGTTESLRVSED